MHINIESRRKRCLSYLACTVMKGKKIDLCLACVSCRLKQKMLIVLITQTCTYKHFQGPIYGQMDELTGVKNYDPKHLSLGHE